MANVNAPHGIRPQMRSINGGPSPSGMPAHKLVGDGTALYIYDAVKLAASGVKASKCITAATATNPMAGVNLIYGVASKLTDHIIQPANGAMFDTQIDTIALADLDKNCALVNTAGNTGTKISQHSVNGVATTAALDFKVMGLVQSPDTAIGAYARITVLFNNLQLFNQVVGV